MLPDDQEVEEKVVQEETGLPEENELPEDHDDNEVNVVKVDHESDQEEAVVMVIGVPEVHEDGENVDQEETGLPVVHTLLPVVNEAVNVVAQEVQVVKELVRESVTEEIQIKTEDSGRLETDSSSGNQ